MFRKKLLALAVIFPFILITLLIPQVTLAETKGPHATCSAADTCPDGFSCQLGYPDRDNPDYSIYLCQPDTLQGIFGKIKPPDALKGLVAKDPTGAGGISQFLSNLIALIYSIAAIVLIFMLIWGAFDWITSEGDKEKLQAAQRKIINAFIGILLFAAAFAIIQVLGQFTGFTFFVGQK